MNITDFFINIILVLIILYVFCILKDKHQKIMQQTNKNVKKNILPIKENLENYKYKNFKLYYPEVYVGGEKIHKWDNNGILKYGSINMRKQPMNKMIFEL